MPSFNLLRATLLVAAGIILAGCAARQFTPVAMSQPGDEALDCSAIAQQIAANRSAAEDFVHKDKRVEQSNVAKNVGGVIPGLGLLLVMNTDLSNEEQVKARALVDRNERLVYLEKEKGCPTS